MYRPRSLPASAGLHASRRSDRTISGGATRPDGSQVATVTGVGGLLDLSARRLVPDPRERFRALATDPGPLNL
jgi:hypothetical protein